MADRINTPEIIKEIAQRMGCYQKDVSELLGHFTDIIVENLKDGKRVYFHPLGVFYVRPPSDPSCKRPLKATVRLQPAKRIIKEIRQKSQEPQESKE